MNKKIFILICFLFSFIEIYSEEYYGYILNTFIRNDSEYIEDRSYNDIQVTFKNNNIYVLTYPATIYSLYNKSILQVNGYGNKQYLSYAKCKDKQYLVRVVFIENIKIDKIYIYINDFDKIDKYYVIKVY